MVGEAWNRYAESASARRLTTTQVTDEPESCGWHQVEPHCWNVIPQSEGLAVAEEHAVLAIADDAQTNRLPVVEDVPRDVADFT